MVSWIYKKKNEDSHILEPKGTSKQNKSNCLISSSNYILTVDSVGLPNNELVESWSYIARIHVMETKSEAWAWFNYLILFHYEQLY